MIKKLFWIALAVAVVWTCLPLVGGFGGVEVSILLILWVLVIVLGIALVARSSRQRRTTV